MQLTKPILVRGGAIAGGRLPLVCTPLVARDEDGLRAELAAVCAKAPDLIEWRVDFFGPIAETGRVLAAARGLREGAEGIPIIFTRRSTREGGQPIALSEQQVLELYEAVCDAACVDFVDWELSGEPAHMQHALAAAHRNGAQLIASFHDFARTPPAAAIVDKFLAAAAAGADIAKVAVMPQDVGDVLTLLSATLEGHRRIALPIVSMSMGAYGSLTRLIGWAFGSSITFAVGDKASAPGQVPIDELRAVLEAVRRAMGVE